MTQRHPLIQTLIDLAAIIVAGFVIVSIPGSILIAIIVLFFVR